MEVPSGHGVIRHAGWMFEPYLKHHTYMHDNRKIGKLWVDR
jgi:hypothetical protein